MRAIRIAVPSDGASIGEAHAEAWRVAYADLFPPDVLGPAVEIRRHMWDGLIGDPHLQGTVLVSEQHGEVVGFIHFGASETSNETGEVYGFYVHPAVWGSGCAQALMEKAIESMAEALPSAILWTHAGAGRARRFYAKSGWSNAGNERQETTWDGLVYPAVEYQRRLSPD